MKSKGFQSFKSTDALSVFALLGAVFYIISSILVGNTGDRLEESAKFDMQSLSAQIVAGGLKTIPTNASQSLRRPASVLDQLDLAEIGGEEGKIGRDPWGHSFHYKVVKSDQVGFVVLISGGPDGVIQTDYTKILAGPNGHLLGAKFSLDDIGYVKKIQ